MVDPRALPWLRHLLSCDTLNPKGSRDRPIPLTVVNLLSVYVKYTTANLKEHILFSFLSVERI
jgi:hypothetical protein